MRILVDIGHPAHIHLFKNFIWQMQKKGHKFLITSRDKECTLQLLDAYGFKYVNRGTGSGNLIGKALNMLKTDVKLFKIAKKFKPDVLLGVNNPYIAHVSKLIGRPSIIFNDTEHAKLGNLMVYPFATKICTPSCYKGNINKKQIRYNGYHELAYLYPKYFKPDPKILEDLGLKKNQKFFVLRFVSWEASHDIRSKGISFEGKKKIVKLLEKQGRVFISSEAKLDSYFRKYKISIDPAKFHSILFYSSLFVGEGSTSAIEAALLGTPAVHFEAFRSKSGEITNISKMFGNIQELQEAGIFWTFCNEAKMISQIKKILSLPNFKEKIISKKLKKLLSKKIDVNKFIINLLIKSKEVN